MAPFEEFVPLPVALKLFFGVDEEGGGRAEGVHLYGVVNDQVYGNLGIDFRGIAAHAGHGGAERGKVYDGGDAGEVLQDDAAGFEGDFMLTNGFGVPLGQLAHMVGGDDVVVAVAQEGFEQDFDGVGKAVNVADAFFAQF